MSEQSKATDSEPQMGKLKALRWYLGLAIENARVILPYTIGRLIRQRQPTLRIPPAEGISVDTSQLLDSDRGTILVIAFAGRYPPGSMGNAHAARMQDLAKELVAEFKPAAVLFDLQRLNYVWGDSICGLAFAVMDLEAKAILPSCLYARGGTATALSGLFVKNSLFELAGMKLFERYEMALEYLRSRLDETSV